MSISNYVSSFLKLGRIERALDIGAYRGEFTNLLKSIWPGIQVQQFEADERNKKYLKEDAFIGVLGNENKQVDFYTIEDTGWGTTTGSSIFLEQTEYYTNPIITKKEMIKLDDVVDMSGDWSKSLVKIDTQGSELLILDGAKEFLKQNPKYILLECSYVEYNKGCPLINETLNYMHEIGYRPIDIMNNTVNQADVLFKSYKY